jgi:hypothetical protein
MLFFLILFAGIIGSAISALWTLNPDSTASTECILGYKSHCSFTPFSTIILLFTTIVLSIILLKLYRKKGMNL